MNNTFQGKVAVVTGGASGIGEACVRLLAERGARCVVADIAEANIKRISGEVGCEGVVMDVRSQESVEASAADIEAKIGPVDLLVTSAGVSIGRVPPQHMKQSDWDRILDINLRGTWLCAVAFGSRMIKRRSGNIVTIASLSGMRSRPLHAYAPSKAAIINMTANLAAEWGPLGVRVNSVSPGFTLTPLQQGAIDRGEKQVDTIYADSALKRMVMPVEIAKAVAFLASDESSAITGINLPIDAGWLAASAWHTHGGLTPTQ